MKLDIEEITYHIQNCLHTKKTQCISIIQINDPKPVTDIDCYKMHIISSKNLLAFVYEIRTPGYNSAEVNIWFG